MPLCFLSGFRYQGIGREQRHTLFFSNLFSNASSSLELAIELQNDPGQPQLMVSGNHPK